MGEGAERLEEAEEQAAHCEIAPLSDAPLQRRFYNNMLNFKPYLFPLLQSHFTDAEMVVEKFMGSERK